MPNFSLSDEIFERAAEEFRTPFHLYDEAGLRRRARRLNAAFSWCPDFRRPAPARRHSLFLSSSFSCYEVTFVKGAEKFSQKLDRPSNFNPDSTWKEL